MVRLSRSHIRFGTFERLHYLKRRDLIGKLLDHVIETYYPHLISPEEDRIETYIQFYAELVERVAQLAAQWMAAGFCHAVLNTDNMSITGESFDYGPYAFIPTYNPQFTAAYFDYYGRYCYDNQPGICRLNLEMLQKPLGMVIPVAGMEAGLAEFDEHYFCTYRQLMVEKLGFEQVSEKAANELLILTLQFLKDTQVSYHGFFADLARQFDPHWRDDSEQIFQQAAFIESAEQKAALAPGREFYHHLLQGLSAAELEAMARRLRDKNPKTALVRPVIEKVWKAIDRDDDWQPFYELLQRIRAKE
jgi:uncharacterized protein YdiU (UPF0061 family)